MTLLESQIVEIARVLIARVQGSLLVAGDRQ